MEIEYNDPDGSLVVVEVEVTGTVTGHRATWRNPEPWCDVEIESVTLDGAEFELDAEEEARAEEELARQAREDADDYDYQADDSRWE
jgi:hypothetical protein